MDKNRLACDLAEATKRTCGRSITPSELPFRPEDLERLISTGKESHLTDDVLNTLMRYIVACQPELKTLPNSVWPTDRSSDNILRCGNKTVFVCPVDVDGHAACLTIHVDQRKATLIDPLSSQERTDEMSEELASRFVRGCLPQPFNNWDEGWKTTQPDPGSHICEPYDSRLYILWVICHIAAELEIPSSFDSLTLRSWLYDLCTKLNHIAGAACAPGPALCLGGTAQVVSGTASKGEKKLSNVFEHQWSEYFRKCAEAARTRFSTVGTLGSLQQLKQEKDILEHCLMDCTSQLRRSQGFAKDLVTLIQSLCTKAQEWSRRLSSLKQAALTLRRVKEETGSLLLDVSDQDELDRHLQRSLELIGSEQDKFELSAQLEKALDSAEIRTVKDYIQKLIEDCS